MARIESFLSTRLFLNPVLVDDRIYFISNLAGRMSLFAMDYGGSVPQPLLPPDIALQNPHLIEGNTFAVFPRINKILIMLDKDGDENYQPVLIPMTGGYPEPSFNNFFKDYRLHLGECDPVKNMCYFTAESRTESMNSAFQGNLTSGELVKLAESQWGAFVDAYNKDHTRVTLIDGYTAGDNVLYCWDKKVGVRKLLYGTPREDRQPGQEIPLSGITATHFTKRGRGLIFITSLFDDNYGLGYLELDQPSKVMRVKVKGLKHRGSGELIKFRAVKKNLYILEYNIDGCSWLYEASFDEKNCQMCICRLIIGKGDISEGVLESVSYEKASDTYILSHSTATSPTQIYSIEGKKRRRIVLHTREQVLGIAESSLSAGEDASFTSFDGLRTSARLYLPTDKLKFPPPFPLVYYIHGGPQAQERPDFAWFSMPLIQFLTLHGFAVFVPNVRGSTGYGMSFAKQVDHDWGGLDRLDHAYAMQLLKKDPRLDATHAAVVGRSYGGYMTLTLASRHPELWSAAADMFGPYDLLTFSDRLPETWKPYARLSIGDPQTEPEFLVERSPRTYIDQIQCPLLVIQGKNDPRVVEQESSDLVEHLRKIGKQVDYLMFENEGHDVLKLENRITCYNAITEFFKAHLLR
jgi:pimeloyl-ACP methyl ester carboxylesterase